MRFPVSESSAPQPAETAAPSRKTAVMPPDHPPIPEGVTSDTCPVNESARSVWIAAAEGAQQPVAGSSTAPGTAAASRPLSTEREISSIPRGAGAFYRHNTDSPEQPVGAGQAVPPSDHATGAGESVEHEAKGNWVYPSEQQFFNAMLRKNHDPKVADMRTIVPIHNAVNERAWEQVLAWEAGMGGEKCPGGIKLSSFVGRPQERSPKAWLKTVFGYTPPFDRHDWYVDRCGTQVRYVIDFYTGRPDPARPGVMSFYLDVRPALDDWASVSTRLRGLWK